ncbi:MAG TPA: amino acid permease [Candidatus Onthocola stercorigallinarum]|nr:amino acid permease [Candidatus Onthocola stercorigallinarum]
MEKKKKKFKLFDAILATVCITLVAESVTPTAAIGNSQYFWWIFLIIAFCIPYGMISAELGTTYPSEGGMYDWVKRAFGAKMASRVAWNYWINFPLWIASLAVAVTDVVAGIFDIELNIFWLLVLQLGYTWLVSILGTKRIGESKWIVNIGTFCKILFMVGLGILGIYVFIKTGESANPIESAMDLLPTMDLLGLSFLSVIIFNFLGFEVVATFVDDMENPKREIPKALIIGGVLMALFYILPATGVNIAMSLEEAEAAGITDSFLILLTRIGINADITRAIVIIVGLMFIYTMVANIVSWSFGVNSVAKYSADDGGLPKVFSKTNKEGVPYMSSIMNGIVASVIIIIGIILGEVSESASNLFWTFFSLSLVTLLISYIPLFLSFIKLRKTDKTPRVYKVPGGKVMTALMAYVPFILLVLSVIFTLFGDFSGEYINSNIPLRVGVVVSVIIQEILAARVKELKKN